MKTYTCLQCGKEFGRNGTTPAKYCSRRCSIFGTKPRRHTYEKISLEDAVSKSTIHRRRREAGLVRSYEPAYVDLSIIESWCDELAWLTGLIWSDGNLSGNRIHIASKDFQLIDLVLSLVGGRYGFKNQGQHLRVDITSREMASFFRSIGLTERKSLTAEWPIIPSAYSGAFMRGLIDGDGSVLLRQVRPGQQAADLTVQLVTASPFLRDGVANWFRENDIAFSLHKRENVNPIWAFTVRQQSSLRELHSLLYPRDDVVCLHRKRIPFDLWLQIPRARSGRPLR